MSNRPEELDIQIDFETLPRERLASMAQAGEDVIECHRVLANTSDNIVGELLRDVDKFYEWNHYPDGDVYDPNSHAQYYYHAHPQGLRGDEHGHFHTFLRPLGMPAGMRPAPVDDLEIPEGENDALSHLIGISMDKFGIPVQLFTTNRWVTGETWYGAADVRRMIDGFIIDHARPSWPVNRWVSGMLRLFRPQIAALLEARDSRVAGWAATHPDRNVYEDRELEVTSVAVISVDGQREAVQAALARRG